MLMNRCENEWVWSCMIQDEGLKSSDKKYWHLYFVVTWQTRWHRTKINAGPWVCQTCVRPCLVNLSSLVDVCFLSGPWRRMLELLLCWASLEHCQQLPANTLKVGFPWILFVLLALTSSSMLSPAWKQEAHCLQVKALCNETSRASVLSTWRCRMTVDPLKCG